MLIRLAKCRPAGLIVLLSLEAACASAPTPRGEVKKVTVAETAKPEPMPESSPVAQWDALVEELLQETFEAHPTFAASQGRHEFDGRVPDVSAAGIAREVARLERRKAQVEAFPADSLDKARAFELEYVLSELDSSLFWLTDARTYERSPLYYSSLLDPSMYLTLPYAPLAERMKGYVRLAQQIPTVLGHMRKNLKTPLPKTYVAVAAKVFSGLGPYLANDVKALFADVNDPELQKAFDSANTKAVKALNEASQWVETLREGADDQFAMGAEQFARMLWATERVRVPLQDLESLGRADLERNLDALEKACLRLTRQRTLDKCIKRVQRDKPPTGPVQAARDQLSGLKTFVLEQKLVSIPGTEEAHVEEAPPYKRWNSAYIEIPGPFEQGLPSTYYIAPPDPKWSKADRQAYIPGQADLLFTSVHEVWPGHFLQFLHASRSERLFGRLFVGYAFSEGWAHYSEELVIEAGLGADDPAVHVGQLLNALLRNVRFLSAIGLHARGMKVEESERMFREKAFQDPGNARQQAARGTFDPGYLNYTLGKLMLRKMRADWTEPRGGRKAWRDFHDRVLAFGGPPLPLVRKALLGGEGSLF